MHSLCYDVFVQLSEESKTTKGTVATLNEEEDIEEGRPTTRIGDDDALRRLLSMGFEEGPAREALAKTGGSLSAATAMLLR